ncbi:glycosyltransferase [Fructilactobacillus carniphilus]|uniref:Glycosyltransferase n=1 Tax=Fructilactobacillus carniphilus TaxID=2940297 RepID=A0ABY5BV10_9LACO|nr:glycosyltransferase [Fructilactobacillus carniphilus]USS90335.1 glycosyltransferase [Fructilactobacillus carniphilus]
MTDKKDDITFVGSVTGRGGIETVLTHVLKSKIINSNFNLSFFLFRKVRYQEFFAGLKDIKTYKTNLTNNYSCLIRLLIFLISYQGDALVFMGPKEILVARWVKKIFRKKYKIISWMHNSNVDAALNFNLLPNADFHLAISNEIKHEIEDTGVSSDKIKVIYNPIEPKTKTITPNIDKTTFIYVSRIILDGQKNLRGLLEVLKNLNGNWELDVYGSGRDLAAVKAIVNSNSNLKEKIHLKGWSQNPWDEIEHANALLLNSNFEGFGMVLAEAMSYGIPCISSDCKAGPNDIIRNNENGFLYPVGDYTLLANDLTLFCENKVNFVPQKVKESINFLYDKNYDARFVNSLKYFLSF